MEDQNSVDNVQGNDLDNWYGGPKRVGIRDIIVGLTFIAVIVLTMVIFGAVKEMKQQAHINSYVTCPDCGNTFIPEK